MVGIGKSTFAQEPPPSVEYRYSVCTSSLGSAFHVKSTTAFIGLPVSELAWAEAWFSPYRVGIVRVDMRLGR